VGTGHTEDQGHVGHQAVTDPEDGSPGTAALDVSMVVLGRHNGSVPTDPG
jgi:hypothetical protein